MTRSGIVKIECRYTVEIEFNPVYDNGDGTVEIGEPSLEDILKDGELTEYGKEIVSEGLLDGMTDFSDGWFPRHTIGVEYFPEVD